MQIFKNIFTGKESLVLGGVWLNICIAGAIVALVVMNIALDSAIRRRSTLKTVFKATFNMENIYLHYIGMRLDHIIKKYDKDEKLELSLIDYDEKVMVEFILGDDEEAMFEAMINENNIMIRIKPFMEFRKFVRLVARYAFERKGRKITVTETGNFVFRNYNEKYNSYY